MAGNDNNCTKCPDAIVGRNALEVAAAHLAAFHRPSWRDALGGFALAATRLHRYRDLRTRMLHSALCDTDCGPATDKDRRGV